MPRRQPYCPQPPQIPAEFAPAFPRSYARYAEIPSYASGFQTFKYGKLGEVTENIRMFALPFESQTYTFKMQYKYDSWNRMQTMTYPDGEYQKVYFYDRNGHYASWSFDQFRNKR